MSFKTIEVLLTANDAQLRSVLLRSAVEVKAFGGEVDKIGSTTQRSSQIMTAAFASAGVAAAAGLAYAVKGAADFEAAMRNVNSLTHESEAQFASSSARVLDLSRELPQSATTLAKGLYEIASSGFQGAAGLQVLEQSAKAASAGLTTTDNAAKAITAVLNAYGLQAKDAADVSDVLFQTVNLGVINFEELTSVIGDTVGMAAAAKVDIGQVGAAIATMTLSGISGAEAGTSLNRVFQSLLKPSGELTTVLHSVGYESGLQALQADGLRGVMDKLRGAVGSNAEAWIQLFPEVRAARGALALTANEGQNYARVAGEIEDKNKRVGATQNALNEQMKSLTAQFHLFVNQINAGAIEVGTHLLPGLVDLLHGVEDLARSAVPGLAQAFHALQPFFKGAAETGSHLVDIATEMATAFAPLDQLLLGIAASGVIGSLNLLATALSTITGFLADHPALVEAVAIAYGVKLTASVLSAAAAFTSSAFETGALKLMYLGDAAQGGAAKMLTLQGAVSAIAFGAAAASIYGLVDALNSAHAAGDKLVSQLRGAADLKSSQGIHEYHAALVKMDDELERSGKTHHDFGNAVRGAADALPIVNTGVLEAIDSQGKLRAEMAANAVALAHWDDNLTAVARATGTTTKQADDLAKSMGVDLSGGFAVSEPARQRVIDHFNEITKKALGAGPALKDAALMPIDQLQALADASDKAAQKVGDAFASATNIISNFKAGANLGDFLNKNLADANTFVDQVQEAARRGLDPTLIQQLLEAGPSQAAPFLAAVTADHSGRLIALANDTQSKLSQISSAAIEMARVTQRAINATSVEMAADFSRAMDIMKVKAELGGAATAQSVADKLAIGKGEVQRVAGEYVIVLGDGVNQMPGVGAAAGQGTADNIVNTLGSRTGDAGAISQTYGHNMLSGLNPVLAGVGAAAIEDPFWSQTSRSAVAAEGGYLPKEATFARGTRIQWAEPETEGEWFIPAAKSKAGRSVGLLGDAAAHFGYDLMPRYAEGGFHSSGDVPAPPDMSAYGNWVGATGDAVNHREYDAVVAYLQAHPERTGGDGGAIGSGWRAITDYLDGRGVGYSINSTTGGSHVAGSLHYQGKAVDLGGNLRQIFDTLLGITSSLQELFYDPAGFSVKNGERVGWTVGGHSDHVHAATFDRGGWLQPGHTMAYNGTGRPEAVGIDYDQLGKAMVKALSSQPIRATVDQVAVGVHLDSRDISRGLRERKRANS